MMITMENMCKSYRIAKKKHIYSISIPAYRENLKILTEFNGITETEGLFFDGLPVWFDRQGFDEIWVDRQGFEEI